MYDFAHPICDFMQGVTHSLCTLEFEDHRPLYDWVGITLGFKNKPRQIEFARLNVTNLVMSKRYLKKLVEDGCVAVGGKITKKAGAEIRTGDEVTIEIPDAVEYAVQAENIPIEIVYQDKDFAVVNKPKGMTVHVGNGVEKGTLVNALLYALDSLSGIGGVLRPGIVHRIDKDTTGLLVVAKNDKAHVSLASQIAQKTCKRTYYALLEGNLKTDSGRVVTDVQVSLSY